MTAVVILAKVSSTYWKPNETLTSTSVIGGKKIALILKPLLFHFFWVHPNVKHNQVEPPKNCFTDFFFFSLLLLRTWDKGSRGSNTSRQKLQSLEMTNHLLLQGLYYPLCKRNRINWHHTRWKVMDECLVIAHSCHETHRPDQCSMTLVLEYRISPDITDFGESK